MPKWRPSPSPTRSARSTTRGWGSRRPDDPTSRCARLWRWRTCSAATAPPIAKRMTATSDASSTEVMGAIEACRTAALGGHVEQCADGGFTRQAYNSCRNRHCPKCQGLARAEWLAERQAELLPTQYCHVVFTMPAPIAEIAFQNKAIVYGILFKAAAETLRTIAADPKHPGAEIGLVAVLHAWGQNLHHHPHVHCVAPGGGPSLDGTRWVSCRPGFFPPVRVLSRLYRRLFLESLQAAFEAGALGFFGDLAQLAQPAAFAHLIGQMSQIDWVVYAKPPFGGPERVLAYRAGPGLSGPLHPSRRHRQQPPRQQRQRSGRLSLERLSPSRQGQGHDPGGRRVHPPLPAARAPRRLPPHPPLWLSRQSHDAIARRRLNRN